ncbi:MAG TPA: SusC/RagA family TonB-linked outer membrane protein, partial [Paludibacteraceae bacterium]|nr:SusC/RagA family TonB-linked outer membrane protein [Paludibacteraceae bacterium]
MRKLTLLVAGLFMLCASAVYGQSRTISGKVVSLDDNEPVIGASILVKGTTNGTISDVDGGFELSASPEDTLVVSYIGMSSVQILAKNAKIISLQSSATELEEVVTFAYATGTKKSFTGSATIVGSEKIEKKNATEVSKALAGEVAGLQVVSTSGQPGTSASVRIRGIGSVNSSTDPLYVVDGIPYDGDVSAIDPSDIASTTVLKDATATSLYGSRGANGVILITTKKGTAGAEAKIDVDVKYGVNTRLLPMYDVVTSPEEYATMSWQGLYNYFRKIQNNSQDQAVKKANDYLFSSLGIPVMYNIWNQSGSLLINPYAGDGSINPSFSTDALRKVGYENLESWKGAIFRVGQKMETNLKIHGGSDKTTYYTSFGYLKDEGYYIGSDYNRFTVRSNIDHQAKKWLKGNLNLAYTYSEFNNPGQSDNMNNGFNYVNGIPPIYPVYQRNPDGSIKLDSKTGNYAYDYGMYEGEGRLFGSGINPAGALQLDKTRQLQHQVSASGMLEIQFYKDL